MDVPMEPSLNIWAFFFLLAAAHGLFLSVTLLLLKRGNRIANRFLAVLVLVFSLRLIEVVAYWTKYLLVFPHLFSTTASILYLYGPLLFLYARFLGSPKPTLKKGYLLHGLPYLIHTGVYAPLYVQSSEFKIYILTHFVFVEQPDYSVDLLFFMHLFQLPHMLLYIYLTVRLLKTYARKINGAPLSFERLKLDWLRKLTIAFGGFWGFWFVYTVATVLGVKYHVELDYIVTGSFILIIYGIGWMTLRQPEVFSGLPALKHTSRYEKSSLTPAQAEVYLQALLVLMEQEQPFLQRGLKLEDLARRLSVSPHHLSQIINDRLNQNFYDLINSYRVEQAKVQLADPAQTHLTILSIAYEVGFNNKASFNAAFKKHTGLTPSQFKKSAQASLA